MLNKFLLIYARHMARTHGFIDPAKILSQISGFAQPSQVKLPSELLRATLLMYARGLLNAQSIQQNMDWVWPFWVNRQFDPKSASFIPRAFSLTHLNLTHRNWTAVGLPDFPNTPIVDARGLVMPYWDSWSIDAWLLSKKGEIIPARMESVRQWMDLKDGLRVITESALGRSTLRSETQVLVFGPKIVCATRLTAASDIDARLVVSVRPYNPEGVSLVKEIYTMDGAPGFIVNNKDEVYFDQPADKYAFSDYRNGDVYLHLDRADNADSVSCGSEMATAAAIFNVSAGIKKEVGVSVPIGAAGERKSGAWAGYTSGSTAIVLPEQRFQELFDIALRTLLLHSGVEVYAGPYTYRRFWFRDAIFISYALLSCGFFDRVERIIDGFHKRQKASGYFESQEGEWDSNGQVLWLIQKYCEFSGRSPDPRWKKMIDKAASWIKEKAVSAPFKPYDGLMPPGFSAEHLGPPDYYYWDDFWSVSGLEAASFLSSKYGDNSRAEEYRGHAGRFMKKIEESLSGIEGCIGSKAMPSSCFRRLDSSSVGSLAAGYPLRLWGPTDERLMATAEYLIKNCLIDGALFHNMAHSGINPYLTLHIAQVMLRARDNRYLGLLESIGSLASGTGQWPEAMHPLTKEGCMGDGQHVWASVEWIMAIRNSFVREEDAGLVLCSGIQIEWLKSHKRLFFGPAWTEFGAVSIEILYDSGKCNVSFKGDWNAQRPAIEISFPGTKPVSPAAGQDIITVAL